MTTSPLSPSAAPFARRRTVPRHAVAAALALGAACGSAFAQVQPAGAATAAGTEAGSSAAPGRTRAEVIAELECARASGELDAALLRSYGLEMPEAQHLPPAACGADQPRRTLARKPAQPVH